MLNSVDIVSQHYELQMDLYINNYAPLAAETIERSMDEGDVVPYNYQLLQLVLGRIESGTSAQLMSIVVMLRCMERFGFTASFNRCIVSDNDTQTDLIGYSFKYDGVISGREAPKDVHAVILSNKALYLLGVLQELPIGKMNSLSAHQEIIDEMSGIILMLYRECAGMFFKSQKLINQLKKLEQ